MFISVGMHMPQHNCRGQMMMDREPVNLLPSTSCSSLIQQARTLNE